MILLMGVPRELTSVAFLTMIAATSGCGLVHTNGSTLNESVPSTAVPVSSGNFVGFYGKTASGNATVYFNGGNSYITHLEGVTLPQISGLQVVTVSSIGTVDTEQLSYFSGNQNYYFTISGTQPTFSQVNIYSPGANLNYAQALLY
jgi:hypothetical protein